MKRDKLVKILVAVVALTFLATGSGKLLSMPPSPENFRRWGLSMDFMRLIGAVEVLGGGALLWRRTSAFAALGLMATMAGALRTGIVFHEALHIVVPAILLVLLAIIAWERKPA